MQMREENKTNNELYFLFLSEFQWQSEAWEKVDISELTPGGTTWNEKEIRQAEMHRQVERQGPDVKSNAGKTNGNQSVWSSSDLPRDRQGGENKRGYQWI